MNFLLIVSFKSGYLYIALHLTILLSVKDKQSNIL